MKRLLGATGTALLVTTLAGCVSLGPAITPGTYVVPGSQDQIQIAGHKVLIRLNVTRGPFPGPHLADADYTVRGDRRIVITIPGRSAEFVYGVGSLDYSWDGTHITVTDRKTGDTRVLSRMQ